MSFLKVIKRDMYDVDKRRGLQNKCVVDSRAIIKLVEEYEKMNSFLISDTDHHDILYHKLYNVLYALYCEDHNSEKLMLMIMDILKPMIEQQINEEEINRVFTKF